jgi:hypothetical protein
MIRNNISTSSTSTSHESLLQKIELQMKTKLDAIDESKFSGAGDVVMKRKIKKNLCERYNLSLWTVLSRPLNFIDSTMSAPHVASTRDPAVKRTCYVDLANVQVDLEFWESPYLHPVMKSNSRNLTISSEQDVQAACVNLLLSIIEGMGLSEHINLLQNRTVAGV